MALNESLSTFDWIVYENNLTTPPSMDQNEDDHVTYGFRFLFLTPVCLFLVITNSFMLCSTDNCPSTITVHHGHLSLQPQR